MANAVDINNLSFEYEEGAKTIDQMLEESILNVSFRCNNVTYKKFHATNLQTNISKWKKK